MLEKGPAISWTGCPFGELNCSPLFWQAVSEREKNTERIANPKKKCNAPFLCIKIWRYEFCNDLKFPKKKLSSENAPVRLSP
ncbi:MAG: hypothetical protein KHX31_00570 [Akkermansia sp.]|jgi:hypothetical protein|uniref:hypothetical protein n=1 Tax=Akkermansia sp. TaxID=1872421 RepID=UPI0025B902B4|nr:hypothetical protein [Akkermansia sp.]MBS5507103.1 hypothetical protein [Akkermansia sp.]